MSLYVVTTGQVKIFTVYHCSNTVYHCPSRHNAFCLLFVGNRLGDLEKRIKVSCQVTYADPRMLERLISSDSLRWVDGQHLVDEVFGLWGNGVPLW